MLWIDDEAYTLSVHCEQRMGEWNIKLEWMQETTDDPDRYELSNSSGYSIYDKPIEGHDNPLRLVVDEENKVIVTTYWVVS